MLTNSGIGRYKSPGKPNQRIKKEKKTLITQWKSSNQTIPTFCKEQGIVLSQFYYLLKNHRNRQISNQPIKTNNNFIGVEIIQSQSHPSEGIVPFLELELPRLPYQLFFYTLL